MELQPIKPVVEFADFAKLDLRIGTIASAEPLEGSEKLMKLMVDIGHEDRQILAGIQKMYSAEQLVGRQVVVCANLAYRKMAGSESQGMLLAGHDSEGAPVLLMPEKAVFAGSHIS